MSTANYEARSVRYIRYLLVLLVIAVSMIPLFWIVLTSFRPRSEMFTIPIEIIPSTVTLENYEAVISQGNFMQYLFNSIVVCLATTFLSLVLATLGGYGWGKFDFFGSGITVVYIIVTRVIPSVAIVVPLFFILNELTLINTYSGLVLSYFVLTVPLATWLLMGFFENIPDNLLRAARIDGLSEFRIFYSVALPLVKPGIIATGVFSFVMVWQEFLFATTFMQTENMYTMPVGLFDLTTRYTIQWGELMAAAVIFILPVGLLFVALQKYFIRGITGGDIG